MRHLRAGVVMSALVAIGTVIVVAAACSLPDYAFVADEVDAGERVDSRTEDVFTAPEDTGPADTGAPSSACDGGGGGVLVAVDGGAHCFFFTATLVTCPEACGEAGATHLVTFPTFAKLERVVAAVEPMRKAGRYWIGLRTKTGAPSAKKSEYQWVTGEPPSFDKWAPVEPTGTGDCVLQDANDLDVSGKAPAWFDHVSTDPKYALCERDVP
jgi:hypothetical protein